MNLRVDLVGHRNANHGHQLIRYSVVHKQRGAPLKDKIRFVNALVMQEE
jgi:hypothetical protein